MPEKLLFEFKVPEGRENYPGYHTDQKPEEVCNQCYGKMLVLSSPQSPPASTNPYSKVPIFDGADGRETAMLMKKSMRVRSPRFALKPDALRK